LLTLSWLNRQHPETRFIPSHDIFSFFLNSRLAINLYFAPQSEKEVNFNLVCKIQRRMLPVTLNVKAEGYTMNCVLLCEDSAGNRVQLSSRGINQINFGDVSDPVF